MRFSEILEQQRIGLAKTCLEQPELSLDEVAFRLGYSEQSAFGRAFKRLDGLDAAEVPITSGETTRRFKTASNTLASSATIARIRQTQPTSCRPGVYAARSDAAAPVASILLASAACFAATYPQVKDGPTLLPAPG